MRTRLADFLRVDEAGLVFVANATTGVQTVLTSLLLGRRDRGVEVEVHHVPLPTQAPGELAASVLGAITSETRLLVLDHVTSLTGLIMPVR